MAATLGIPQPREPCNFSVQRSLQHLLKHFFLGFLFLLRAKRHHTNQNLFGSTPPSRHNADFCFHRAKGLEKGLRESQRLASVGNLWRSNGDWRWYFGKTKLISMHGVTLQLQGSKCVFNLQEDFLFVSFDGWTMESWTPAAVSNASRSYRCTLHMYM